MSNQVEVAPHEQPSIDHNREQNVMPDELVGVAVHGDLRNLAHQHLNAHKENTAAEEAEKARLAAEEEDARLAREEDARRHGGPPSREHRGDQRERGGRQKALADSDEGPRYEQLLEGRGEPRRRRRERPAEHRDEQDGPLRIAI